MAEQSNGFLSYGLTLSALYITAVLVFVRIKSIASFNRFQINPERFLSYNVLSYNTSGHRQLCMVDHDLSNKQMKSKASPQSLFQ